MRSSILFTFLGLTFAMPTSYAQQGPCAQNSLCPPAHPCFIQNKSSKTLYIYDNGNPPAYVIELPPKKHWCYATGPRDYQAPAYEIYWEPSGGASIYQIGTVPGLQCVTIFGDIPKYTASTNFCPTSNKMK